MNYIGNKDNYSIENYNITVKLQYISSKVNTFTIITGFKNARNLIIIEKSLNQKNIHLVHNYVD